jgi:hypothetical protein
MKKNLANVILDKLRELKCYIINLLIQLLLGLAAGMPVSRMYYTNFDHAITKKYHVILEGWPLEKFCSPSEIASRNEISVLMVSFESGATRFRKLSPTEFKKWSEQRFNATVGLTTEVNRTDATVTPSESSPSPPDSTHESPNSDPLQQAPLPGPQESTSNEGTGAPAEMDHVDSENSSPSSNIPAKRK